MTSVNASSPIRSSSPSRVMPALLTSTSTGPWCSSTWVNARSTASASVTSHWTPNRPSGAPLPRWVTATESPCSANERAIARPIPRLPPVTSTDLPTCPPSPGCALVEPSASALVAPGQDVPMHRRALVRRPGPQLADGLLTHVERTPVDGGLALRQWHGYVDALLAEGWTTVEVPPADDCPDAVFVEDTVVLYGDLAVIA